MERLRSRTAKLNGDPQDLIRTMPAKGDRLTGLFLGLGISAEDTRTRVTRQVLSVNPGCACGSAPGRRRLRVEPEQGPQQVQGSGGYPGLW